MKKHFKGILASILALTMVLGLGACQKKSDDSTETATPETTTVAQTEAPAEKNYVGTWKLTSAEASGMTISDPSAMGLEMSLELKEDGTVSAVLNGEVTEGGKWEEKDGNIFISGSKEITGSTDILELKVEDGKLIAEQESDGTTIKMILEKQ